MKIRMLAILLLLAGVIYATPRGLTSREIIIDDAVSVVQPESDLLPAQTPETLPGDTGRDSWQPQQIETLNILLPAGEQVGMLFNNQGNTAGAWSSLGELIPQSVTAVDRAPEWIRSQLRSTLYQLTPDRQALFADLINTAQDPYVDEIAFCVATSFTNYLNSEFALPQLFLENAQWIYSTAQELPYVEVVDTGSAAAGGDYWSTTRYWKKDETGQMVQVTVPRDIYYWYLVQPKITDEIAAYIDPTIVENNSTHSNNIVPPPTGKFWRSYIYDYEEDGYPVLSDTLTLCQSVFNRDGSAGDAVRAIIWWINQNMSFTSNNERPHQPVRIFEKRFGRCGEYADFTSAISRIALIPCTNISSISTDHTWNEFWEDGWVSWEPVNGYLNGPLVYENGWGKVFGSVFEERCDGLFTPVTDRYSEGLATINIQVVDQNNLPVDGARVVLAILETSPRFDCEAYTDNNGMVSFAVGENRDYRARAETMFGLYPANPGTYAQLVSNSVDGETYNYQFQIAAPLPLPTIEALEPPDDPVQDYRFSSNFQVASYFISGHTLWDDIDVLGTPGDFYKLVDLPANAAYMTTDADNALFLNLENFCSAYSYVPPSQAASSTFYIPIGQDWYSFADNSHHHGNAVLLSGGVWLEHWGSAADDPQASPVVYSLSNASPNPFSGHTTLSLVLREATDISVGIYNLRGQKVRSLSGGRLAAGTHTLDWDGRGDGGAEAPSGVYLVKVENGASFQSRKVLLIR
jgi:hypothetical protein